MLSGLLSIPGLAQAQTTGALHILGPADGQQIDTRFVRLQFELVPGVSANGIPKFKVQLDKENPVLTSDTEYFFYWLTPGLHSVSVALVDANGTPISASNIRCNSMSSAQSRISRSFRGAQD